MASGAHIPVRPRSDRGATGWSDAAYLVLHLSGFAATTLLITWGLFAFFFLALGSFTLEGMMSQIGNLAGRYLAASPERLAGFRTTFWTAHLILSAGVVILRRTSILPPAANKGEHSHG